MFDCDALRVQLVTELGFERFRTWENVTERDLRGTVPQPEPGYDPHREIIAEAPDGQIAAYAVYWLDEQNKIGHFEPVGTHRDFQRRGLGLAVMLHAMRQMQEQRMTRATVHYLADNLPAHRLYESIGFQKQYETLGFRRAIGRRLPAGAVEPAPGQEQTIASR